MNVRHVCYKLNCIYPSMKIHALMLPNERKLCVPIEYQSSQCFILFLLDSCCTFGLLAFRKTFLDEPHLKHTVKHGVNYCKAQCKLLGYNVKLPEGKDHLPRTETPLVIIYYSSILLLFQWRHVGLWLMCRSG